MILRNFKNKKAGPFKTRLCDAFLKRIKRSSFFERRNDLLSRSFTVLENT
ncbi:hypothetical protein LEP1GSC043_0684 [Leptospira weilii str. Ecochallenge]|uniref:Uncharacterized protein n=1 Tax=Leptospira weilii str. Ecochallenge TaxID=1049986 RepID=N1U5E8_9LEPT|nr:hypothetical protein LEP1GSC043_0684 [Leptospira weilii str. Ecochallenge]